MKTIEHGGDAGRQIVPQDMSNLSDADKMQNKAIAAMAYGALGWVDSLGEEIPDYDVEGPQKPMTQTQVVALDLKMANQVALTSGSQDKLPIYDGHNGDGCVLWNWRLWTFKKWTGSTGVPKNLVFKEEDVAPSPVYGLDMQKNVKVHKELVCKQVTDEELRNMGATEFVFDISRRRPVWMQQFATVGYVQEMVGPKLTIKK